MVCAIGDGSFFYNPVISCYGMCQEYDMPILTIVFNNHGYASQQGGVEKAYPGGFASRDDVRWATTIKPRPEYAKLLEAFGGSGQAVDQPADIIPAIRQRHRSRPIRRPRHRGHRPSEVNQISAWRFLDEAR